MRSMTGYACQSDEGEWGQATFEIRSLNHRFLEFNFKLPEALRQLEFEMRNRVRQYCQRGRIDITLAFQPGPEVDRTLSVNTSLAEQLMQIAEEWHAYSSLANGIDLMALLSWPGVIQTRESNLEAAHQPILTLLETTLKQLNIARDQEGDYLNQYIDTRCQTLEATVQKARERRQPVLDQVKTRLEKHVAKLGVEVDSQRLEQEIVFLINKIDVTEELDRLQVHMTQIQNALQQKTEPVGRRVEFLLQEVYREANTLAAKSPDIELIQCAVEIKTLVEQLREQIQNVE